MSTPADKARMRELRRKARTDDEAATRLLPVRGAHFSSLNPVEPPPESPLPSITGICRNPAHPDCLESIELARDCFTFTGKTLRARDWVRRSLNGERPKL